MEPKIWMGPKISLPALSLLSIGRKISQILVLFIFKISNIELSFNSAHQFYLLTCLIHFVSLTMLLQNFCTISRSHLLLSIDCDISYFPQEEKLSEDSCFNFSCPVHNLLIFVLILSCFSFVVL